MSKKPKPLLILFFLATLTIYCGNGSPTQPNVPYPVKPQGVYTIEMGQIQAYFLKYACLIRVDFSLKITNLNNVGGTATGANVILYWQGKVLMTINYSGYASIPANGYVIFIGTTGVQSSCVKPGSIKISISILDNNGYTQVLTAGPYKIKW